MGQYEVRHQCDEPAAARRRTCIVKPDPEICSECRRNAEIYHYSINCQTCDRNKHCELVQVGVGTSLFGADFAIVRDGDREVTVPLSRVRNIKEE